MNLDMDVGVGPGHIVLDGDPAPPKRPQFSARLLWPNGRPSQLLLSTCQISFDYKRWTWSLCRCGTVDWKRIGILGIRTPTVFRLSTGNRRMGRASDGVVKCHDRHRQHRRCQCYMFAPWATKAINQEMYRLARK